MSDAEAPIEIAKEGIKELIKELFMPWQQVAGPPAAELGLALGETLRVWRFRRALRLLEDVRAAAENAGLKLKGVAPRIFFPLLEAASLEEDDDLHSRWVALLTNAATEDQNVLPAFTDILKQLTAAEAKFMDQAYDEWIAEETRRAAQPEHFPAIHISSKLIDSIPLMEIEDLERLMLVTRSADIPFASDDKVPFNAMGPTNWLRITRLGKAFVLACRVPMGHT